MNDAPSETRHDAAESGTAFLTLFALYVLGKLASIPILLETVPTSRWLGTIPIGILISALVIRAGQLLSARTGLGLPFVEGRLAGSDSVVVFVRSGGVRDGTSLQAAPPAAPSRPMRR